MWRGETYTVPIADWNPYMASGGRCLPTLARDTGRGGIAGSSVGTSTVARVSVETVRETESA